jgi:hypothetical protein
MRYLLNVYRTGFVYIGLRFYTAWTHTGRAYWLRRWANRPPSNTPTIIPKHGPTIQISITEVAEGCGNCSNAVVIRLSITGATAKANEPRDTSVAATVPARMKPTKIEACIAYQTGWRLSSGCCGDWMARSDQELTVIEVPFGSAAVCRDSSRPFHLGNPLS